MNLGASLFQRLLIHTRLNSLPKIVHAFPRQVDSSESIERLAAIQIGQVISIRRSPPTLPGLLIRNLPSRSPLPQPHTPRPMEICLVCARRETVKRQAHTGDNTKPLPSGVHRVLGHLHRSKNLRSQKMRELCHAQILLQAPPRCRGASTQPTVTPVSQTLTGD